LVVTDIAITRVFLCVTLHEVGVAQGLADRSGLQRGLASPFVRLFWCHLWCLLDEEMCFQTICRCLYWVSRWRHNSRWNWRKFWKILKTLKFHQALVAVRL